MKNKIDFTQWQQWRWQSETRYYSLHLCQNLFGEWVAIKKWQGKNTRIHGSKEHRCNNLNDAYNFFAKVNKRRIARGYALIE